MPNIQILCVLKKGNIYHSNYVYLLKKAIETNVTRQCDFVCLTDIDIDFCKTIKLKNNWPGWWSKIELFRKDIPNKPSLYFDLDTVILNKIDYMVDLLKDNDFLALRGFNQRFAPKNGINFASGIMLGNFYKYSFVYDKFKIDPEKYMTTKEEGWMHGDQGFIGKTIGVDAVGRIQTHLPDNYIVGKRILNELGRIPKAAKVIAWSGSPRLHDMNKSQTPLIKEVYKAWKNE